MNAAQQFELGLVIQGRYGSYRLDEYLGGGQTSWVYGAAVLESSVADRIGRRAAVKLMLPGLDQKTQERFRREEQTLIDLRHQLEAMGLNRLEDDTLLELTPTVWDTVTDDPVQAIIMSRAAGVSVDQLMRNQSSALSEPTSLQLMRQVAAIFVALHEGLQRAYLDFQPRNIFWDAEIERVMVIDWNLLSSGSNADYAADVRQLARLTYRLLTGVTPQNETRLGLADAQRWPTLSVGIRELLLDVLNPIRSSNASTSRTLWTELDAHYRRWKQSGDDLLMEAAEAVADIPEDGTNIAINRCQYYRGWMLFDMALRCGVSSYMDVVRQSLADRLAVAEEDLSNLNRGRIFLAAGDLGAARKEFMAGIEGATDLAGQLQAWRWLHCLDVAAADLECYRAAADTITALLDELAAIEPWYAVNWQTLADRLQKIDGLDWGPIEQEVAAYASLQELLALREALAGVTDPADLASWQDELNHAVAALDGLPGECGGLRYSTAAWIFVGRGSSEAGKESVQNAAEAFAARHRVLMQIHHQLGQTLMPTALYEQLQKYPGEPLLAEEALKRSRDWLNDTLNDEALTAIANTILAGATDANLRKRAEELLAILTALREVSALMGLFIRLCTSVPEMSPDTPPAEAWSGFTVVSSSQPRSVHGEEAAALDPLYRLTLYLLARIRWLYARYPGPVSAPLRLRGLLETLAHHAIAARQVVYLMQDTLETLDPTLAKRLKHELDQAKRDQQIERSLQELQRKEQTLKQQITRLTRQKEELDGAMPTLLQKRQQVAADLGGLERSRDEAAAEVRRSQSEKSALDQKIDALTAEVIALQRQERMLERKISLLENEVLQKQELCNQLQIDIDSLRASRQKLLSEAGDQRRRSSEHPIKPGRDGNRTFSGLTGFPVGSDRRGNQSSLYPKEGPGGEQRGQEILRKCQAQYAAFMTASRKYGEKVTDKMGGSRAVEAAIHALLDAEVAYRIAEGHYESLKQWSMEDDFREAMKEMEQGRSANLKNVLHNLTFKT